jgi:hypothetical protein
MSQNLERLGLEKIALDVAAKLEPICVYLLKHYNITVTKLVLDRMHPQLPTKIAQPGGYVHITTEKDLLNKETIT